ncbi:TIGR03668 family PPOX class F420-dependent oxidoreductase [Nonomuraea sp. FMUSA5-5]|uniref:TIGR03668 family PPOX class F420-dependent oxidoreductase n=1 Tax=Nonomuraea composti TaxID=2720023 RepID=A0ABX1BD64_9ACTN|nr:TIGR03668 family PPOX class F420-dependent oxidoreductase [Nonomuraea sp. FMUSA5-5]
MTGSTVTRFAAQPVARLARIAADGTPRVVPITFALLNGKIVTAVDHKPKTTTALARLRDLRANPAVSVLADHYDDDWTRLWWVRADGLATVLADGDERERALDALVAKYAQYRERRPAGPVIVVEVTRWSEWSATP